MYGRDSMGRPPDTLLPTVPAEALSLRLALEGPVTVQAQHVPNTLGPGIDGAERVLTVTVRHVPVGRRAVRVEYHRA